jgi:hypothetical protein
VSGSSQAATTEKTGVTLFSYNENESASNTDHSTCYPHWQWVLSRLFKVFLGKCWDNALKYTTISYLQNPYFLHVIHNHISTSFNAAEMTSKNKWHCRFSRQRVWR